MNNKTADIFFITFPFLFIAAILGKRGVDGNATKKRGRTHICTLSEALVCLCKDAKEAPKGGRNLQHRSLHEKITSFQIETSVENYVLIFSSPGISSDI